ncbi:PhzF family phenazine biosynthesis protein [Halorubrum gandharaense]
METRRTLLVDAFTSEPLAGNVAGVVPDADGLSDEQMQRIAAELGASETAFLGEPAPGDDADRRVRYFTPTTEVDLCGHATVAAYAALFADDTVDAGTETLATAVGDLPITVAENGTVRMQQEAPTVRPVEVDYDRLGETLGIDPAALRDVGADLPVAVASTGLPFLVVPVNFLEHLGGASPEMDAVEALADEHDAAGVYAFTFDAIDAESTLHGRAFVPGAGIPEDPVTGTASGACGAYLDSVAAFDGELPERMRFEQGHFVDRPGHVDVWVDGDEVSVGGEAVVSLEGELRVPEDDDDGIIEA